MNSLVTSVLRPCWPAPDRVHALFTTRRGGVSHGPWGSLNLGTRTGDDAHAVAENRLLLSRALELPGEPYWLHQVHGVRVCVAGEEDGEPAADAAWSREPGSVCVVQSADCLPILLCDRDGARVAAVHGGWRGLAAGIVPRAVAALGAAPDRLLAWLGPAICGSCYEVGDEVRAAFAAGRRVPPGFRPAGRPSHWYADLAAIARTQLQHCGLPPDAIYGGDCCTYEDAGRFYSYRRDGITGRLAALIWLE